MQKQRGWRHKPILLELTLDLRQDDFEAFRLGHTKPTVGEWPRPVLMKTTAAGKQLLMNMWNVKYDDTHVYFNHDLTPNQRQQRKRLLPKYRELHKVQIQCKLIRDKIIRDGKEMTDEEIDDILHG